MEHITCTVIFSQYSYGNLSEKYFYDALLC